MPTWVTREGVEIPHRKLTDDHLNNILRYLERTLGSRVEGYHDYQQLLVEQRRRLKEKEEVPKEEQPQNWWEGTEEKSIEPNPEDDGIEINERFAMLEFD